MSREWRTTGRAVFLATVMLLSVIAGGVGFTGAVAGSPSESPAADGSILRDSGMRSITPGSIASADSDGGDDTSNALSGTAVTPEQVDVSVSSLNGSGTEGDPYVITNASELQAVEDDLTANYTLGEDVDAGNTSNWNNGFDPIGSNTTSFTGTFDGDGHNIAGLTIDRTENNLSAPVGLFTRVGTSGHVERVNLKNVSIAANRSEGSHGFDHENLLGVGAVAGSSEGTVRNVSVDGRVSGAYDVGGIVGINRGTLKDVSSNATVVGSNAVGGVIGTVESSGAVSDVRLDDPTVVINRSEPPGSGEIIHHGGGLAGKLNSGGSVKDASGAVNIKVNKSLIDNSSGTGTGGLIGQSYGEVENVSTSGQIRGSRNVGGVIGHQIGGDTTNVSSDATVIGNVNVGGVIGVLATNNANNETGRLVNAVSSGYINGFASDDIITNPRSTAAYLGGLAGASGGVIRNSSSTATINASYSDAAGGLVGSNGGKLIAVSASGDVNATPTGSSSTANNQIGGLVGSNAGIIRNASASGRVIGGMNSSSIRGTDSIGGLVGENSGTIRNASATGRVTGSARVGGLVGQSSGIIRIATARGDVNASGVRVGGLVGLYDGASASSRVTNTSARGSVNGSERVGGLVGESRSAGINHSFAVGSVTGENLTGGIVGSVRLNSSSSIRSYWDINTTGQDTTPGEVFGEFQDPDGLYTSQMTGDAAKINMSELEFGTVWYTKANDYPVLAARADPSALFSIASANVIDATDRNGNVTTNDKIEVRVDVDGSVDSVTANASAFGGPESLMLSEGDSDGTYNATFTVSATSGDGDYQIDVTATKDGETKSAATNAIRLDTDGPVFRFTNVTDLTDGDGEVGGGDKVEVNVTAYDADSGLASIKANASHFGVDSVTLTEVRDGNYTGTFTVDAANASSDGTYSINGTATNGVRLTATNTSESLTLNISQVVTDSTKPVLTNLSFVDSPVFNDVVNDGHKVFVNVTVTDSGGSGIKRVEVDAGGFGAGNVVLKDTNGDSVYNATFNVNASKANDGSRKPTVTATDNAGNANSTTKKYPITLDTDPPIANATANRTVIDPGETVRFNASGSTDDLFHGLARHQWDFDSDGKVDARGDFDFTKTVNHTFQSAGTYTVNLTVSDIAGNTNDTAITVEVTNQAPDAFNDSYSTPEDETLSVDPGVLSNDSDPNGDTLNATRVRGPTNGTLSLNTNGSFSYTPNQSFVGTDSFTYNATDGTLNDTATVTITVSPVNDAPIARDDNYTVNERTDASKSKLNVAKPGVLQNDSDPENDTLTATLVSGPANGSLSLYANGSFTYEPEQAFNGTDSFTYNATDGSLNDTARVDINVTERNSAPTAYNDSYTTDENETLNVTDPGVLNNDSRSDSDDSLTAFATDRPDNGTLILNATGGFSYTPDSGFNGTDSFTYNATDGRLNDTATVTITVQSSGSGDSTRPTLSNPILIDLPDDNGYVADGDRIAAEVTASDSGSGIHRVGVNGTRFGAGRVLLNDSDGDGVYNATFTIDDTAAGSDGTVTPQFLAEDNASNVNATRGPSLTLDTKSPTARATANETKITPGETVRFNASTSTDNLAAGLAHHRWDFDSDGTVDANRSFDDTATVTHTFQSNGTYTVELTVSDRANNTNTTSITIDVSEANQAPMADDDTYNTQEDMPLAVDTRGQGVLANDSDPENDTLTATLVSGPANGSLSLNTNGSFTYTPDQNFAGTDSFTYNATDGSLNDTATVTITVTAVNDAPIARDDSYVTTENTTLNLTTGDVLINDSDPDGDSLTAGVTSLPDNGTISFDNGTLLYTPDSGFIGTDSFTYNASDGQANDTAAVVITVEAEDQPAAPTEPVVSAPPDQRYVPSRDGTPRISYNATGVIDSADVGLVIRNTTAGNDTVVAVATPGSVEGTEDVLIPAGSLSGDVTLNVTLVNASTDKVYASDLVNLTAVTAPAILTPANDTYDPTAETTIGTFHNANGVVAPGDVGVRLLNVTGTNETVVARNTSASLPVVGDVNTTVPAGALAGNVTLRAELYNTSNGTAEAAGLVNLTATADSGVDEPAPIVLLPTDGAYDPTQELKIGVDYNATGFVAPDDVELRFRNATAGNGTVVATATPGSAGGSAGVTIPAGTLSGDVTINVTLANGTTDVIYASGLVNYSAETAGGGGGGGSAAPVVFAPSDDTYDPTTEFNISVGYNATGVIEASDVGINFTNVTAGNDTVVATTEPGREKGPANATIPAGALSGDITINVTLVNTSTSEVYAADVVNLTAETADGGGGGTGPTAPAIRAPASDTYNPDADFDFTTFVNATGVIAESDIAVRLRNVTDGNATVVARNTSASVPVEGEAELRVQAGTLSGNVTVRSELYNESLGPDAAANATTVTNLTAVDAPPTAEILVPETATVGETITLNGSTSFDDSAIVSYNWTVTAPDGNTSNFTGETVPSFTVNQSGTYAITLNVTDDAGQTDSKFKLVDVDGSGGSTQGTVVSSKVTHAGGTRPDLSNVSLQAEFKFGLLQVQLRNKSASQVAGGAPGDTYELEGLGVDDTTRLRVNVTVANFTPRVLIGSARNVTWSRTRTADGNWTVSITGSPAEVHSYFNKSSSETDWNGSLTATQSQNQTVTYALDGLSTVSTEYRERLNGSVFITDAQQFGVPTYNASATPDRVELEVAAPHYETDGQTVNEGFFEAYLPPSLLDEWGVSASDLVGTFEGARRSTTVTATPDGGARVSFNVTYSEGTAAVTYNDSTADAPNFTASVAGTNEPVVAGETLEVTATIENVGNESGTQQVSLSAGGQKRDDTSVQLDPGNSTTVTLKWPTTESDNGTYQATVATENDTASTEVQIREPAFFNVTIDSTNAPVVVGENLTVNATITNTGNVSDTQTIRLSANGTERNKTTRELEPEESQEVQLTWNTTDADAGSYRLSVASADDVAERTANLEAAEANITVDSASLSTRTITTGGTINVTATVNNSGTVAGIENISLYANDTRLAIQGVTLEAGNTTEITFDGYGASLDPGTYEIRVGNQSAGTLTVEESSSGTGAPGFGVGTAVGALALVVLWTRRRR